MLWKSATLPTLWPLRRRNLQRWKRCLPFDSSTLELTRVDLWTFCRRIAKMTLRQMGWWMMSKEHALFVWLGTDCSVHFVTTSVIFFFFFLLLLFLLLLLRLVLPSSSSVFLTWQEDAQKFTLRESCFVMHMVNGKFHLGSAKDLKKPPVRNRARVGFWWLEGRWIRGVFPSHFEL